MARYRRRTSSYRTRRASTGYRRRRPARRRTSRSRTQRIIIQVAPTAPVLASPVSLGMKTLRPMRRRY